MLILPWSRNSQHLNMLGTTGVHGLGGPPSLWTFWNPESLLHFLSASLPTPHLILKKRRISLSSWSSSSFIYFFIQHTFLSLHSVSGGFRPKDCTSVSQQSSLCWFRLLGLQLMPATHTWPIPSGEAGGRAWRPMRAQTRYEIPGWTLPSWAHPSLQNLWPARQHWMCCKHSSMSRASPEECRVKLEL